MTMLKIRKDRTAAVLRKLAKDESNGRVARRLLAIANALSGMSRAEAARSAGMDRQTLQLGDPLQRTRRRRAHRQLAGWAPADVDAGRAGRVTRRGDGRPRSGERWLLRLHPRGPGGACRAEVWQIDASDIDGAAGGCQERCVRRFL